MQNDFDIAAINYDAVFTNSTIGKAQRNQVYKHLQNTLNSKSNQHILELNCGTGEDANYFNNLGHIVTATDISKKMIEVSKQKNKNSDIEFKQLNIKEVNQLKNKKKFDIIFSNFGGFNCLSKEEIASFFSSAKKILNQKGKIALVIMPKNTVWERIYFSLKGDYKKAKRRNTNNSIRANVDGINVKTWYFNPKEIKTIADGFSVKKIKSIGLFVPPSYLQSSFFGKKVIVSFLNKLDFIFGFSFLAKYADHYYIELQKNTGL
ncbi:class I SAM-dependent DNA methyltransferase [Polaribacter porphyrae]|uniref:Methylase n=1 Tax=Polaribacter porphyrae TaxID=1137780 RepID=A0A2S7WP28_9FLAO|nr:class I SAM-dependent methyltransferase [Polaribacter porphyrae]PQJ79343.1 methylase [Polaribacter porphyrae]